MPSLQMMLLGHTGDVVVEHHDDDGGPVEVAELLPHCCGHGKGVAQMVVPFLLLQEEEGGCMLGLETLQQG